MNMGNMEQIDIYMDIISISWLVVQITNSNAYSTNRFQYMGSGV